MTANDEALESLLGYLKRTRGFDFTDYKRASLERRIRKRMAEIEVADYGDYEDYLEVNPDEFTDLFNTILINVTGFFRDEPAWDYIASDIIPKLLEETPEPEPIRVWSAACASGEEAYSLAMLFAEALGADAFRRRVKIYATDVDDEALSQARQAIYSSDTLQAVPKELAERYFEATPLGRMFRPDLRRSVIFGRNDLVQDAPISRVDLLVSRNALMYFTRDAQSHILKNFNYALNETGFLFLGKSEMLVTHSDLFTPYNMKWRVFRKVPKHGLRERLSFITDSGETRERADRSTELRAGALDQSPIATIAIDRNGFVAVVNQQARVMFGLGPADIGRPLQDLELSYRPVDLRSALERAYDHRTTVTLERAVWEPPSGEARTLEVAVMPLPGNSGGALGALVTFTDVTEYARLYEEHQRSKRQLESAYEELQSTVEELETTNEELHSTNEELETTNEELQSSNEELETMNEELQSTNDQLATLNQEQTARGEELDRVNMFLEGILGSLGVGVIVLDRDQCVQVWNASSADLWGLRAEEVEGKPFLSLDINFPVDKLKQPIHEALGPDAASSEETLEAMTRRGRSFECWTRVLPMRSPDGEVYGVILLMADRSADPELASTG